MVREQPTILIVDDDPSIVQSLSSVLLRQNFKVDTALNGSDALRKIQGQNYDVVLCDIEMPQMTGLDFLERVRKEEQNLDIILMTGYLEPDYFIRAIRFGAADFISKPIESSLLLRSIQRILTKKRSLEGFGQLLQRLDSTQISFVIDPAKFSQYNITKAFNQYLQQLLFIPLDAMTELLICIDEMLYNAFIHGTLDLTQQQRAFDHNELQEIISAKLLQPEIAVKRIRFTLDLQQLKDTISISVEDDGDGFDYQVWMKRLIEESNLNMDEHGRGLTVLYHLSDSLEFFDGGRKVRITRKLDLQPPPEL